MDNAKIEVGYALPKERWREAADNLQTAGASIAEILKAIDPEGRGEQVAQDWLEDVLLACLALLYVAEFATDKCRVVPLPESKGGNNDEKR